MKNLVIVILSAVVLYYVVKDYRSDTLCPIWSDKCQIELFTCRLERQVDCAEEVRKMRSEEVNKAFDDLLEINRRRRTK
ncbi:hypothetical protein BNJ_00250 [Kaumoebavirus]|uniref:hypothetical protein n=1 Tax=Kaumoebavirus TaxID=1859492 RepID=UPI0009C2B99C|nr:hypothetical protein BNJ_00250 [Kaumoebavirus]ARA72078.1 hypothetical protein BNJ_00250 [Kaumoebavirus]